jgi:predicted ArsR family transcriptional regulator
MSPSLIRTETHAARPPVHEGRPNGDRQRKLLMALVASNPGVHILRAAALLGLNWNTCLHHVRRLEGAGLVTVRKVNGRVCLFDRRAGASNNRMGAMLLRDERNAAIARLLIQNPGTNQKSLAEALGLAASVVHYRMVRLEEAGLIERVNQGREVSVFATEALEAAYAQTLRSGALVPPSDESPAGPDLAAVAPGLLAIAPLPFDVDAPVAEP